MYTVGIDEAGRGAWAGPLAAAAVLVDDSCRLDGVTDSKKLTKAKREQLFQVIQQNALQIGVGFVSAYQIDTIGLQEANRLAMERALAQISGSYDKLVIDGHIVYLPGAQAIIGGDGKDIAIGAASIVAKVLRDRYMTIMAGMHPDYGFEKHVGYGTALHRNAIEMLGLSSLHRLSFKPVGQLQLL